jgi:hypothetical protein
MGDETGLDVAHPSRQDGFFHTSVWLSAAARAEMLVPDVGSAIGRNGTRKPSVSLVLYVHSHPLPSYSRSGLRVATAPTPRLG